MNRLEDIKVFIQKNATVMAELARLTQHDCLYSSFLSEDIIEQQQELRRYARRVGVIAMDKPFFEEAEFRVHLRFDAFCSFIDLNECIEKEHVSEGQTYYHYSIIIDNMVLIAMNRNVNEEHKKAQAI